MAQPAHAFLDLERTGARIVLRTPFVRAFVDELKSFIPYDEREWDANAKLWAVDRKHLPRVRDMCARHFGNAITYGPALEAAMTEQLVEDTALPEPDLACYMTLGTRTDAPTCVVHGAMRAILDEYALREAGGRIDVDAAEYLPDLGIAREAYVRICATRQVEPWPDLLGLCAGCGHLQVAHARLGCRDSCGCRHYIDAYDRTHARGQGA
jgi:hypothetical protein